MRTFTRTVQGAVIKSIEGITITTEEDETIVVTHAWVGRYSPKPGDVVVPHGAGDYSCHFRAEFDADKPKKAPKKKA